MPEPTFNPDTLEEAHGILDSFEDREVNDIEISINYDLD